jgi:hypothetical protein
VTLPGPSEARFDAELRVLIAEARLLVNLFEDSLSANFEGRIIPGHAFPAGTVGRLMLGATPLYESGLLCLSDALTSIGAYGQLRTLIETWAHLDFIEKDDGIDSPECRAIRIELGTAELILDLVEKALTAHSSPNELSKAQSRMAQIGTLYEDADCKGPRRTYRSTDTTLREISKREGFDWLLDAYKASSQIIHGMSFDWSIGADSSGSAVRVVPRPSQRAARLGQFVLAFDGLVQASFRIVGLEDRRPIFRAAVEHVLDNSLLVRAVSGEFD